MNYRALWLSASVLTLGWCGAAAAQTASAGLPQTTNPPVQSASQSPQGQDQSTAAGAQATTNPANSATVSEVVVTAERRTTNLQTTPIAATVLTEKDLIRNGVVTIDQLQFLSPSLAVDNFGQGNDVDIRGIGKGEHNTQTTTGVVTYRDGVATFPGYIQEEPYYDVSSVEVLRGPQGTFSGQNSTGGAVIVSTTNPVIGGGYNGYLFAHYGNYNDTGVQGAVNLPVSDTFAARVAFNTEYRDSFYHITGLTGDPNVKWGSARLSLLWQPTTSLKVLFKTDYSYLDNGGYFGDAILTPTGKLNPTNNLFNFANNYETYAVDQMVRSSLRVDYTTDSGLTFRSITGYQRGHSGWKGDIDGTNLPSPNYIIAENVPTTIWSQEFNIISPSKGPVTWVLGAYYVHNHYEFSPSPAFDIGVPPGGFDEDLTGNNVTHTYAGFGQVSFNLPAGFQLQAGMRYSLWSTTNNVLYFVPEYAPYLNQYQDERYHGNNTTGKVTLNWTLDRNNFLYAFVASGAKPGGLNTSLYAYPAVPIPAPFKQEYVIDYEVGWKSRMLDGHLRTQLGAYYNDFKHFQVVIPIPDNPQLSTELNTPRATLYGVEASAQAVFGNFSINGGLGLEHTELGTFYATDPRLVAYYNAYGITVTPCDINTGPTSPTCANLHGHEQTYAPSFTFNVQAQYDYKLASGDTLTPAVNFSHISHQWATLFENTSQGDYLAPRDILGASLAWTHKGYTTTLYVTNLTDEHYISAILSPIRIAGAPRQFGISVYKAF